MTTLAGATLALSKKITFTWEGTATGGSATTLIDTAIDASLPNDYFNGGTIWILSGNNIGKCAVITNYDNATYTFTFATMTLLNASGNRYAVANKDYPLYLLKQAINEAMKTLGPLPDIATSIVTVGGQEEYNLPAGIMDVRRLEIAANDDEPYDWSIHRHWKEIDGKIIFDSFCQPKDDDLTVRITYYPTAVELVNYTDVITPYIHIDRLAWESVCHALRWRLQRTKGDEPDVLRLLNEALANAQREELRHPVPQFSKDPHLASW